jgi:F-type H+-transporting ATPase subunit delta
MPTTIPQARRGAKKLFRWCLINGSLDTGRARRVVASVLESRRRGYITLLGQFHRLVKLEFARHTAKIESAAPLPPDLQARVQAGLEGAYGAGITTLFAQNPALIGGIRIRVASDVYDGSVQSRLAALRRSFGIAGVNGRNA